MTKVKKCMKLFIILYRRIFITYEYQRYDDLRVKEQTSIDEMKNCTYAFIKYFDTLKYHSFNENKTIFIERMKNTQKLDM
nr:Plasmodium exported protein (PHISTa), unknown, putative [Plasmodium sp. DRC-Itaito]